MTNEEIAQLKSNNERLNKIIDIVVEQNELLKLENAFLKKALTPKDMINSFAKIGVALKDRENALVKLDEGLRAGTNNPVSFKDGNNNVAEGITNFKEGNNNDTTDRLSNNQGINNNAGGMVETNKAGNNAAETMPQTIEPTNEIIGALEEELRASGYNRVSYSGVNNAAKLLMHFYNKGSGSYPELKKITGHSTDGIAKFIMGMKKRDWIHRYGFQQFGLTGKGVALIKQALSKSREN